MQRELGQDTEGGDRPRNGLEEMGEVVKRSGQVANGLSDLVRLVEACASVGDADVDSVCDVLQPRQQREVFDRGRGIGIWRGRKNGEWVSRGRDCTGRETDWRV